MEQNLVSESAELCSALSLTKFCSLKKFFIKFFLNKNIKKRLNFFKHFCFKTLCWRRATFPKRVSSLLLDFTSVFGMRTGIPPTAFHQHRILKFYILDI